MSEQTQPEDSAARRPEDDTCCPTCGGSAHALDAITASKFGGREYKHRYARKRLDEAWKESDRLAIELDSTYAHLRAVIENCKHSPVEAIRHQLVGLLPETREMEPETKAQMREKGLGHLVERHERMVQGNWSDYLWIWRAARRLGAAPMTPSRTSSPPVPVQEKREGET